MSDGVGNIKSLETKASSLDVSHHMIWLPMPHGIPFIEILFRKSTRIKVNSSLYTKRLFFSFENNDFTHKVLSVKPSGGVIH